MRWSTRDEVFVIPSKPKNRSDGQTRCSTNSRIFVFPAQEDGVPAHGALVMRSLITLWGCCSCSVSSILPIEIRRYKQHGHVAMCRHAFIMQTIGCSCKKPITHQWHIVQLEASLQNTTYWSEQSNGADHRKFYAWLRRFGATKVNTTSNHWPELARDANSVDNTAVLGKNARIKGYYYRSFPYWGAVLILYPRGRHTWGGGQSTNLLTFPSSF